METVADVYPIRVQPARILSHIYARLGELGGREGDIRWLCQDVETSWSQLLFLHGDSHAVQTKLPTEGADWGTCEPEGFVDCYGLFWMDGKTPAAHLVPGAVKLLCCLQCSAFFSGVLLIPLPLQPTSLYGMLLFGDGGPEERHKGALRWEEGSSRICEFGLDPTHCLACS